MNLGRIEDTNGEFDFYYQGSTPSVARLIEAIDKERVAVGRAFGVELPPTWKLVREWYDPYGVSGNSIYEVHHSNQAYRRSNAPRTTDNRYITEDIPYGLVPLAELGDRAGVETPHIDAIITVGCAVTGRDFVSEARGLKAIGWNNLSVEEIIARVG
jgi:opine dehydrogenase